jgi:hypothetical protein
MPRSLRPGGWPAPAAVFANAQTGESSAPSQSKTEPNLAWDKTTKNGGFIRGKTPPDTRHQTPSTHQTPLTHQTPNTATHQTPNTADTPDTRHQKSKHQTPNVKTRFASILFCGRTQGSKPLNRALGPVHSFEINDSNLT